MNHIRLHTTDKLPCRRCGGELYLTAELPHPTMPGRQIAGLCPQCDASRPEAQELLAYFAIHETLQEADLASFHPMVDRWLQGRPAGLDPQAFDDDVEAWRAGKFDD